MDDRFTYADIYDFSKVAMFDLKEKIKDGKYVSAEHCWFRLCLDALDSCIQAYCGRVIYRDKKHYFLLEMHYTYRIEAVKNMIVQSFEQSTHDLIKKVLDNKDKDQYSKINQAAREINEKIFESHKELATIITGAMYSDKYLAFMEWANQTLPDTARKLLYRMYSTSRIVIEESNIVDLDQVMYWKAL